MKSKRWVNGLVFGVLALDVLFVMMLAVDGGSAVRAQPVEEVMSATDAETIPSSETLLQLGRELAGRTEALERREAELEERLRGTELLKRVGLFDEAAGPDEVPEPPAKQADPRGASAFESLQRAYENMEPGSAAAAVAALAERDKSVVVALLLGWKPRTSGAILDSLTQSNPQLAADLSYEIWKLSSSEGAK